MTLAYSNDPHAPGTHAVQPGAYQPGVCNIGPAGDRPPPPRRSRRGRSPRSSCSRGSSRSAPRRPSGCSSRSPRLLPLPGICRLGSVSAPVSGPRASTTSARSARHLQVDDADARRRDRARATQIGVASSRSACRWPPGRRPPGRRPPAVTVDRTRSHGPRRAPRALDEVAPPSGPTTSRRSSSPTGDDARERGPRADSRRRRGPLRQVEDARGHRALQRSSSTPVATTPCARRRWP